MPPICLDESDDDSELSDVDEAVIESVTLSDTPKSTVNSTTSAIPEIDEMNGDRRSLLESQTIAASSNIDQNGKIIDLDTSPPSENEDHEQERFVTASESPKNARLSIQSTRRGEQRSSSGSTMGAKSHTPQSNTLKRKTFPSESPQKASTSPTVHRPHLRSNILTSRQTSAAVSERQSTSHRKLPSDFKIEEETARLREVLLHVSTEAQQAILREQWRSFLFTNADDTHITFVLRAGLKNANSSILARVFKDPGVMKETLIEATSTKQPIIAKVLKNVSVNSLADLVPEKILDQALAERVKSVPAKTLIRWLAEADRLGYSVDDVLDDTDETVVPKMSESAQSHDGDTEMTNDKPTNTPEAPSLDPLIAEQKRIIAIQKAHIEAREQARAELRCPVCTYKFNTVRGYNFHRTKNICTKPQAQGLKFYCGNCAQGFTTKQGMLYHEKKRVCLGEDDNDDEEIIFEPYHYQDRPNPAFNQPHSPYLRDLKNEVHAEHPRKSVGSIPRPPLHTPTTISKHISAIIAASSFDDEGSRQSPSELTPERRAALESALQRVEEKYAQDQAEIPEDWPEDKREARLISLKNGNASRKSQIRKQFGVTLRMREKDKEAKKRREVLGSVSPYVTAGGSLMEDFLNPPAPAHTMSAHQMHQNQQPIGMRMEMVDMRPAPGFSPINGPPQHQSYSQAPPAHTMMQYSAPSNQGFRRSFPPAPLPAPPVDDQGFRRSFPPPPLMSQPRPDSGNGMSPANGVPEQASRGAEEHANKRLKRNSSIGMPRAEEERSRLFAAADSAPMVTQGRSASRSGINDGVESHQGGETIIVQRPGSAGGGAAITRGGSRSGSAGSSVMSGNGAPRTFKRVPVGSLQRKWEALDGKPSRRSQVGAVVGAAGDGSALMRSIEGSGREIEKVENGSGDAGIAKGKAKQLMGRRGVNFVDLISDGDDSREGTAGASGDER